MRGRSDARETGVRERRRWSEGRNGLEGGENNKHGTEHSLWSEMTAHTVERR